MHLKSPGNWINDPNGFIYFKGKYHLFYQYFPYNTHWGTMHWAHAVGDDLIKWEHKGIALYPTKAYDRNGVFSGSAIEADGQMRVYYTGAEYVASDPENIHCPIDWKSYQSQVMISSEDGYHFDNIQGKKQIIPLIYDTEVADPYDCRDPKVWKSGDTFYMCLGSTHLKKEGVLLVFSSKDGKHWERISRIASDKLGIILECPDMFEIEGQWFLISSPIGILSNTSYPENQSIVRKIEFDENSGAVSLAEDYSFIDYGMDIYAPQSNLDADGNRTMIAWVRMPEAKPGNPDWIGMMCLPRVLQVRDGILYTPPHPNIRQRFEKAAVVSQDDNMIVRSLGNDYQYNLSVREGESIDLNGVSIRLEEGHLISDRSKRLPGDTPLHSICQTPYIGKSCYLEIYMDADIMEIYVNDGRYVITNVLY